jgi:hypothetical protein
MIALVSFDWICNGSPTAWVKLPVLLLVLFANAVYL